MRPRSTSATFSPSPAEMAATDKPAAPAPITTTSKSGMRSFRPCWLEALLLGSLGAVRADRGMPPAQEAPAEGAEQRQRRQPDQRQWHARGEDHRQVRTAAGIEHLAEARPDAGEH